MNMLKNYDSMMIRMVNLENEFTSLKRDFNNELYYRDKQIIYLEGKICELELALANKTYIPSMLISNRKAD